MYIFLINFMSRVDIVVSVRLFVSLYVCLYVCLSVCVKTYFSDSITARNTKFAQNIS